jgi:hypothetical protein
VSALDKAAETRHLLSLMRARGERVCGFLDADGQDYCGRDSGHRGRHYCSDPAGPITGRRPCLAGCGRLTTAHEGVCLGCRSTTA